MNSEKFPRGALYVRMSTDHQRYSITHQTTCLRAYAEEHGIQIVKVYEDAGKSGLTFAGRPGLRALIRDVSSGLAEFNTLLVYDVSRWGRFQDVDESAYHEYTCRMAGIRIVYCEEPFENDGSGISSIVKSLKRVMAGEYSRELSRKVYTSKRRLAGNGHRQGGPAPFGLDRYTLDAEGNHHGPLGFGEQKHRVTDRVVLRPGAPKEVNIVQRIFELYDLGYNGAEIATHLNAKGIKSPRQLSWRGQAVMGILRNDAYVGVSVWGKTTSKLMSRTLPISRDQWVVADDAFEGIIDKQLFARVRQRIESTEHIIHSTPYLIQ